MFVPQLDFKSQTDGHQTYTTSSWIQDLCVENLSASWLLSVKITPLCAHGIEDIGHVEF